MACGIKTLLIFVMICGGIYVVLMGICEGISELCIARYLKFKLLRL